MAADVASLDAGIAAFNAKMMLAIPRALLKTADFVMLESQKQVPLDTGWLQNSGTVEALGLEVILGYHAVYAAFQHEGVRADGSHVVQHWQNGRKKKYISDPINDNETTLLGIFGGEIQAALLL